MEAAEIRRHDIVGACRVAIVLPPREGFGPAAVGAIGLLVNRLAAPDDVVIGQARAQPPFAGRRFVAAETGFWPPFGRASRYLAGVVRTLRRLRPALVEVHNRAGFAARIALACPWARVILFVHNDPRAMRGAKTAAERAALGRAVTVVCVSHSLAARFMEGMTAGARAPLVLPNAIDLADVPRPAGERDCTVLFAGRMVSDKGADAFVRACAAVLPGLPGWRAVMLGADRFWPNSPPTPFELGLAPRARSAGIEMLGYVPHDAVLAAMARAAIVVVPSRWAEPFGLTALEAMASGAALVCSPRGGLREVAGDAAVYADPDEPGVLETAITLLAGDPTLRALHGAAGLVRARLFDAAPARTRLAELRDKVLSA